MQGRYAGSSADRAVTAALCRARCVKQFSLTGPWPYRGVMSQVREMNEADVEAVSAIRVRGWQAAYAGIVPQAYLDAMTIGGDAEQRRDWFSRPLRQSTDLVALDSGDLVGWISFGPYRGQAAGAGRTGEVYALYVRPDLIGRGVGRTLLGEVHARMEEQRFQTSALWVLDDNQRARRFYERAGYQPDGGTQEDDYDGVTLTELRYRRALGRPGKMAPWNVCRESAGTSCGPPTPRR